MDHSSPAVERGFLTAVLSASITACGGAHVDERLHTESTELGDTTVVTTTGEPDRVSLDSVQVIWRSPELESPGALLPLGDRLIVGDRARVHILTRGGEHIRTVGREGEGPDEFLSIVALGRLGPDTVAVLDNRNQRMSFLTPEGDPLGSVRITPAPPYVNPRVRITGPAGYRRYLSDTPLVPFRGGVLSLWRENSRAARPTRLALVWRDLEADTVTVLEAWDGERLVRMGDFVAADPLFGPRVIATLDAQGTVAVGYGTEYCIDIHAVGQRRPRRVCRNREPAPVGAGIRDPDLSPIENEARREAYAAVVREQPIAEHLPYYDRLLFDEGGRLWVRTLGPELSEIHPYVLRAHPELGPAHRAWDVFAPAGQLIVTLEIPSTFEPEAITSDAIYGFVELSTGEIAIGALAVPFRPDPTRPAGSGLVSDARDDRRLMETG